MNASRVSDRRLAAAGGVAILAWVGGEFLLRRVVITPLAAALGTGRGADTLLVLVGFPALAALAVAVGRRVDVSVADRELRPSAVGVTAAVGGVVVWFAVLLATALAVVDSANSGPASGLIEPDAPAWVVGTLLVSNVLVGPVAEELAWRGIVQTVLDQWAGTVVAVVVTALAFAGKHLVVDLAGTGVTLDDAVALRVVSLLTLGVVFCLLRARYGTGSAIVAHVLANGAATVPNVF